MLNETDTGECVKPITNIGLFGKPCSKPYILDSETGLCCIGLATGNVLKVQNSWGADWGNGGFGYFSMEPRFGACGINYSIGQVTVKAQDE